MKKIFKLAAGILSASLLLASCTHNAAGDSFAQKKFFKSWEGCSKQIWNESFDFSFDPGLLTILTSNDTYNWWGGAIGGYDDIGSKAIQFYDLSGVDHVTFSMNIGSDLTEFWFIVGNPGAMGANGKDEENKYILEGDYLKKGVHSFTVPKDKIVRPDVTTQIFTMGGSGDDNGKQVAIYDFAFWDEKGKEITSLPESPNVEATKSFFKSWDGEGCGKQLWNGTCNFGFEPGLLSIGTSSDGGNWWGCAIGGYNDIGSEKVRSFDLSGVDHITFTMETVVDLTKFWFIVGNPGTKIDDDEVNKYILEGDDLEKGVHKFEIPNDKLVNKDVTTQFLAVGGSGKDNGIQVAVYDFAFWDAEGNEITTLTSSSYTEPK